MEPKKEEAAVVTPEAEAAPETKVEAKAEEKKEEAKPESDKEKKEVGISEALGQEVEPEKPKVVVPEAAFLDEKKGRKEAEAEVKRLQAQLAAQGNAPLTDSDLESIAKDHNVDIGFLNKISTAISAKAQKDAEAKMQAKFDEVATASKKQNFDATFETHLKEVLETMPEFKDVADKESVKAVVLEHLRDEKRKNTTLPQILEKMYGKATTGKRTIEQKKPAGSKEPGTIDRARADKDPAYLAEIMASPELKKQYNEGMTDRLSRIL